MRVTLVGLGDATTGPYFVATPSVWTSSPELPVNPCRTGYTQQGDVCVAVSNTPGKVVGYPISVMGGPSGVMTMADQVYAPIAPPSSPDTLIDQWFNHTTLILTVVAGVGLLVLFGGRK